ncbi:MAG: PRC-barrel domain-containing protein [Acidimicrobiales bacterium]
MDQQWTNRPVVDEHHARVGKVTDVFFGEVGDQPEWAAVKTGLLAERLAPLDGAYVAEDGTLVLPYSERTVKGAPKPPRDHILTPADADEAMSYYDLN